jgi:hypothetical protein
MSDVENEAETEIERDDRPIKEIMKEASREFAKAKGRQAFFFAVKLLKAKAKDDNKSVKSVRIPKKRASALRPGDVTEKGEVKQVGKSPIEKNKMEITFLGERGVDVVLVESNTQYEVVERRSIK